MAKVIRTTAAKDDLADIWLNIAQDNLTAADLLLGQIDDAFSMLARTPDLGFTLAHVNLDIRCKPVKRNYLIFYKVIDGDV